MISQEDFERLISKNESSVLDFKEKLYDFSNDKDYRATSKFVKDIISFSNTIRNETAYILFGVAEKSNGELELKGIENNIDDSILQDKLKNKVFPRPFFSFYRILYQSKCFGIIEIPVYKYEMPITPSTDKLKGLEVGKAYYRNGSANTEATTIDSIRINDWLKGLPSVIQNSSFQKEVSKYLVKLTNERLKLSTILSELFVFSKENKLEELQQFSANEIHGIKENEDGSKQYRVAKVLISPSKVEINPYSGISVQRLRNEMENSDDFFDYKLLFHQPILKIESYAEQVKNNADSSFATMKTTSKALLNMPEDYPMYIYIFPKNFIDLYHNIRQKAIDLLMKV